MSRSDADTDGLVRYLVESLVEHPEAVKITRSQDEDLVRYEVELDPEDVGKVIGRGGRIIKAIRTLARAAGSTTDIRVDIDVVG